MQNRLFIPSLLLSAAAMAAGCAEAGKPLEPAALQQAQLIVKFRPASFTCDAPGIAALAARTKLDLHWIRPMSGDACVLRVVTTDAPSKALATLQARPEIEWAEADAVMRPNKK